MILYDGVPINEYNIDSFRIPFSSMFQQTKTLEISIAENIALYEYKEGYIKQAKQIESILVIIGTNKHINSLPYGINTHLSRRLDDEGVMLSGGQLQKIAFARAFLRDAKIPLFDDPS